MDKSNFFSELKTHLFIELYFRKRNLPLLESFRGKKHLFESYGLNNECVEIVRTILKNLRHDSRIIRIAVDSSFVDSIVVYFTEGVGWSAGYAPSRTKIDSNGRFSEITVYVNPFSIDSDTLETSLIHEITHAYQDYNLRKKGSSLSVNINKRVDYSKLSDEYINSDDYHIRYMAKILYLLNGYEKGAFISELKMSLKGRHFDTVDEVMVYLRGTDTYFQFEKVIDVCNNILNRFDYGYVNAANKILGVNFNTVNQFRKWFNACVYRVQKKLEVVIPKIAAENITMTEMMIPRDFINFD